MLLEFEIILTPDYKKCIQKEKTIIKKTNKCFKKHIFIYPKKLKSIRIILNEKVLQKLNKIFAKLE